VSLPTALPQEATGTHRDRRVRRVLATGLAAAVCAGLLTGVVARVLMRVVALAAGHAGEFTLSATLGILLVFIVAAMPGALLAAASTGRARWSLLAAGAVLLCVPATGIARDELGSTSGFSLTRWTAVIASTAGVYLCIAALPLLALRLVDRRR
jgi:hypothetical protein